MRSARAVLTELVVHVHPPRGCGIVVTEWKSDLPPEPNWLAASGIMSTQTLARFTKKVARSCENPIRRLIGRRSRCWAACDVSRFGSQRSITPKGDTGSNR